MKQVLFVCTHNAGRSQMAQAFFERHAPDDLRAESAGQEPAPEVWPEVVEAMNEVGIRTCADAILAEYQEAPVRSFVMTIANRRARACLKQEHCHVLSVA